MSRAASCCRRIRERRRFASTSAPACFERSRACGCFAALRTRHYYDRAIGRVVENSRAFGGRAQPAVEHHARERPHALTLPRRQERIIDEQRLRPDGHGVHRRAQDVRSPVRFFRTDRRALARSCGDACVEAGGRFRAGQAAAACAFTVRNAALSRRALRLAQSVLDDDAVAAQFVEAMTAHARIGIGHRRDDARNAGVDDATRARPGSAGVAARLERHVERAAASARRRRRRAR